MQKVFSGRGFGAVAFYNSHPYAKYFWTLTASQLNYIIFHLFLIIFNKTYVVIEKGFELNDRNILER